MYYRNRQHSWILIATWRHKDVHSLFMENEEYIIQVTGFFFPLLHKENREMSFSWLIIRRYDAKLRAFNWERENWHWYWFSFISHVLLSGSDLASLPTWCSGQLSIPSWWQWGFLHRCDATCHWNCIEGRPRIKEPSKAFAYSFFIVVLCSCTQNTTCWWWKTLK